MFIHIHQLFRIHYTSFWLDTVNIYWWWCINLCRVIPSEVCSMNLQLNERTTQSGGGMIRLETLIELRFINSSFTSFSSCWNSTSSSLSSNSRQQCLSRQYPLPLWTMVVWASSEGSPRTGLPCRGRWLEGHLGCGQLLLCLDVLV